MSGGSGGGGGGGGGVPDSEITNANLADMATKDVQR